MVFFVCEFVFCFCMGRGLYMRIYGRKIREVLDWLVGWLVVSLRDILICIQPVINGYD
jgi:hypothetical protein